VDPQLLANLTRLGPVKVDHGMHGLKPTGVNASRILNTQKQSETEAQKGETKRNHVQAPSLFDALTRLQVAKDESTVERLAGEYNLDGKVLRELGKTVNVPTPDEATARTVVDEDGAEVVLKTVRLVHVHEMLLLCESLPMSCSPGEMGDFPIPQVVIFSACSFHVKSQVPKRTLSVLTSGGWRHPHLPWVPTPG